MGIMFRSLLFLLALTALGAAVMYATVHGSLPPLDGKRAVAGPASEVAIERDALGATTIIGRTPERRGVRDGLCARAGSVFPDGPWAAMSAGRLAELCRRCGPRSRTCATADIASPAWQPTCWRPRTRGTCGAGVLYAWRKRGPRFLARAPLRIPAAAAGATAVACPGQPDGRLQHVPATQRQRCKRPIVSAACSASRLPPSLLRYVYSVAPVWEAPIDGLVMASATMPTPDEFDLRRYAQSHEQLAAIARTAHHV